jgi:hypothetical protein
MMFMMLCLNSQGRSKASPRKPAASARPRLDVLMHRLGLASPRGYCLGLANMERRNQASAVHISKTLKFSRS